MAQIIPIQPVSSQIVSCVLGGQNVQIAIYLKSSYLFVDINSNSVDMCVGSLALNNVPLDACNSWDGFVGNLYIIDTQGDSDPVYTGLGSRWLLVYLTPAEIQSFNAVVEGEVSDSGQIIISTMILIGTANVSASQPGNFSFAHNLGQTPFLIEITPTGNGSIWAQSPFADSSNLYLTASDAGVTATVALYVSGSGTSASLPAFSFQVQSSGTGNFTVAHGLTETPSLVEFLPTSFGNLWQTAPPDATNLHLAASDVGVSAEVSVFPSVANSLVIVHPGASLTVNSTQPGAFSVAHGLATIPSRIEILMLSSGAIIAQNPSFDGTNVYLEASDAGLSALISVYS